MPYFVCSSGLFCLALEDGGSCIVPGHLRLGDGHLPMTKAEVEKHEASDGDAAFSW